MVEISTILIIIFLPVIYLFIDCISYHYVFIVMGEMSEIKKYYYIYIIITLLLHYIYIIIILLENDIILCM